ncbi:IS110 family transposase [Pelagibius sp. Alg239-R121]|uniref:IS110 family transposase n=1 Tax=Pelagibius sp. Alg239-R121 TaxID=2993448 RepID=UPI0024A696FE|nr:IS110 family transposase [Pelagibius sp. Alg239-R121]
MSEDIIIGVDLAKNVFQLHGAQRNGQVLFRKKLSRAQFRTFCEKHPRCLVAMEACSTSHYWARELQGMGHEIRLIPPLYVKPFVKRNKNDAADAEAITEAALRPSMSYVVPKSADQQASTMMMRTRDQLLEQRTATVNALRGHLAEFGIIAPVGIKNVSKLRSILADAEDIPVLVTEMANLHFDRIDRLSCDIEALTAKIKDHCCESDTAKRLRSMPGIGPIAAIVIEAFAPDMAHFEKGRDFAAWLGLVPKQHSSGGKTRLGQTSKMGQRDIRRVLITGAMSRIAGYARQNSRAEPWLQDKLDRKPKMIAAIALANKMARQIWAMITKEEKYQPRKIVA